MHGLDDAPVMAGLAHKPKMPRGMKDARKHGVHRIEIENHHDGSHKMTFHHMKHGVEPTTHGAQGLEELHDKIEEMLGGKPSHEEMEEE